MMPGPYRCGCNASYGQSCDYCDGTEADRIEMAQMRRRAQGAPARPTAEGSPAVYTGNEEAA